MAAIKKLKVPTISELDKSWLNSGGLTEQIITSTAEVSEKRKLPPIPPDSNLCLSAKHGLYSYGLYSYSLSYRLSPAILYGPAGDLTPV